jgi:hypothetical protein
MFGSFITCRVCIIQHATSASDVAIGRTTSSSISNPSDQADLPPDGHRPASFDVVIDAAAADPGVGAISALAAAVTSFSIPLSRSA